MGLTESILVSKQRNIISVGIQIVCFNFYFNINVLA
jgi:hypothetical protein